MERFRELVDGFPLEALALLAALGTGFVVFWIVGRSAATLLAVGPPRESLHERNRVDLLREGSATFRACESLIARLARRLDRSPARLEPLERALTASAWPLPWTAAEFIVTRRIEAVLMGVAGALLGGILTQSPFGAAALGLLMGGAYQWAAVRAVSDRAARRLNDLKRRLPFAVDLMALMIEVGAGFPESLAVVARDNPGTPLAEEFGRVLREISLGKSRREALESLRDRFRDEDLSELIVAIVRGDELGTPLSQTFRAQAQRMMTKHSLWIERASSEAEVMIVFPGMIVMVACLLIVVAPFLLGVLYNR